MLNTWWNQSLFFDLGNSGSGLGGVGDLHQGWPLCVGLTGKGGRCNELETFTEIYLMLPLSDGVSSAVPSSVCF